MSSLSNLSKVKREEKPSMVVPKNTGRRIVEEMKHILKTTKVESMTKPTVTAPNPKQFSSYFSDGSPKIKKSPLTVGRTKKESSVHNVTESADLQRPNISKIEEISKIGPQDLMTRSLRIQLVSKPHFGAHELRRSGLEEAIDQPEPVSEIRPAHKAPNHKAWLESLGLGDAEKRTSPEGSFFILQEEVQPPPRDLRKIQSGKALPTYNFSEMLASSAARSSRPEPMASGGLDSSVRHAKRQMLPSDMIRERVRGVSMKSDDSKGQLPPQNPNLVTFTTYSKMPRDRVLINGEDTPGATSAAVGMIRSATCRTHLDEYMQAGQPSSIHSSASNIPQLHANFLNHGNQEMYFKNIKLEAENKLLQEKLTLSSREKEELGDMLRKTQLEMQDIRAQLKTLAQEFKTKEDLNREALLQTERGFETKLQEALSQISQKQGELDLLYGCIDRWEGLVSNNGRYNDSFTDLATTNVFKEGLGSSESGSNIRPSHKSNQGLTIESKMAKIEDFLGGVRSVQASSTGGHGNRYLTPDTPKFRAITSTPGGQSSFGAAADVIKDNFSTQSMNRDPVDEAAEPDEADDIFRYIPYDSSPDLPVRHVTNNSKQFNHSNSLQVPPRKVLPIILEDTHSNFEADEQSHTDRAFDRDDQREPVQQLNPRLEHAKSFGE